MSIKFRDFLQKSGLTLRLYSTFDRRDAEKRRKLANYTDFEFGGTRTFITKPRHLFLYEVDFE